MSINIFLSYFSRKLILLFFILLTFPSLSFAHENRPLYLQIIETGPGNYSVNLKIPTSVPEHNIPKVLIPGNCTVIGDKFFSRKPDSFISKYNIRCEGSLSGNSVRINFPLLNPSISTIIRVKFLSGQVHNKLLSPNETSWEIPAIENRYGVAKEYLLLGISHIWEGIDHLLFLLCLIVIAATPWRILITVTGFTVAHTITLVLSTLNLIKLPVPPIEAAIALSIVFVASEIVKGQENSLTYKYPVSVSSSFGLLHGFGFAAVLNQIGLPQVELPVSLLFFNIGVEIGQVIFIAIVLFVLFLLKSIFKTSFTRLMPYDKLVAYLIGSVASFWMIQRIYSYWL